MTQWSHDDGIAGKSKSLIDFYLLSKWKQNDQIADNNCEVTFRTM